MICKHAADKSCINCKWWGVAFDSGKGQKTCQDFGYTEKDVCTQFEALKNQPPEYFVRIPELGPEKQRYLDLVQDYDNIVSMMKNYGFVLVDDERTGKSWYNFYWDPADASKQMKLLNASLFVNKTVGKVTPVKIENVKHLWPQLTKVAQRWLDTRLLTKKVKACLAELVIAGKHKMANAIAAAFRKAGVLT